MDPQLSNFFVVQAADELFDHHFYSALAQRERDGENRHLLQALAGQEHEHFLFWMNVAGRADGSVKKSSLRLWMSLALARVMGIAFIVRRLERSEEATIARYEQILDDGLLEAAHASTLRTIVAEEREHEREMQRRLMDERVAYLGAAVLGLNDALVELTGGLTGLVSSISDPRLIGFSSLIIGIAASFSMAASNFLSAGITPQATSVQPKKAAVYTGVAYILVVISLVAPFFIFSGRHVALAVTWALAVAIIAAFAYYSAVLQDSSFARRFTQMMVLGLGVAVITFVIGRLVSRALGIQV